MSEAAAKAPQVYAVRGCPIAFSQRLIVYAAVWGLAALALQIFLQPEALTETPLTPLQQRLSWIFHAPLMVVLGLARAFAGANHPDTHAVLLAVGCLITHAALALSWKRIRGFAALALVQVCLLAIAVTYFIRISHLTGGG